MLTRQTILLKYQGLIKQHMPEIAKLITLEQGKTLADAEGDVFRGIQVVEHCCSIGTLSLGEYMPNLAKDLDSYSYRVPLGVQVCGCEWYCFRFRVLVALAITDGFADEISL